MRVSCVLALLLFPGATFAEAAPPVHGWQETHIRVVHSGNTTEEYKLKGFLEQNLNERWGVFGYLELSSDYHQAYGGLTYTPTAWMQVGLGLGLEEDRSPFRMGGFIFLHHRKFSLLFIEEYGGSGEWHRLEGNVDLSAVLGIGVMHQKSVGAGPRIQIRVPHTSLLIWAAPLYNPDDKENPWSGFAGIRTKF